MPPVCKRDEAVSPVHPLDLLKVVDDRVRAALRPEAYPAANGAPAAARAAMHHLSAKGQRVRTRLALQAGVALGLGENDAVVIATAVELLHNASLIHDDLQDRDPIRRGRASVWAAYGDDIAICAGDLLLSGAYASLAEFSKPERIASLICLTHSRTAMAIAGQCADLGARRHAPMEISDYERIVAAKSGALIALPLELALLASDNAGSCAQARLAAESFAVGYQIVDDIEDRESDARTPCSLNIISVLRQPHLDRDELQQARSLGLERLSDAATAALLLPRRCGDLLRECALRLSAQL